MQQIWESMVRYCEMRGRELLDADVITTADLYEWLQAKNSDEAAIISVGLPCYSFLQALLNSIKANSGGLLLLDGVEVTYFNRPKEKLLDWFFNPVMVLKEQIRVIRLGEDEVRFLEKAVLFGSNTQRTEAWQNGSLAPQDALRAAQIQGISRRYEPFLSFQLQVIRESKLSIYLYFMSISSHFLATDYLFDCNEIIEQNNENLESP